MKATEGIERFVEAQRSTYSVALSEIKNGKKKSHWMWFVFPQVQGLALSQTALFYAIKDADEAREFLNHEILGPRLVEISNELLNLASSDASNIFGYPDNLKLFSCMTLFAAVQQDNPVFEEVLNKFFEGKRDARTLAIISNEP